MIEKICCNSPFPHRYHPTSRRKARWRYGKTLQMCAKSYGHQSAKNKGFFAPTAKKDQPQKGRSFANVYTMGSVGSSFLALLNTTWLGSILALRSTNPFMPEAVHRWDTSDCI